MRYRKLPPSALRAATSLEEGGYIYLCPQKAPSLRELEREA